MFLLWYVGLQCRMWFLVSTMLLCMCTVFSSNSSIRKDVFCSVSYMLPMCGLLVVILPSLWIRRPSDFQEWRNDVSPFQPRPGRPPKHRSSEPNDTIWLLPTEGEVEIASKRGWAEAPGAVAKEYIQAVASVAEQVEKGEVEATWLAFWAAVKPFGRGRFTIGESDRVANRGRIVPYSASSHYHQMNGAAAQQKAAAGSPSPSEDGKGKAGGKAGNKAGSKRAAEPGEEDVSTSKKPHTESSEGGEGGEGAGAKPAKEETAGKSDEREGGEDGKAQAGDAEGRDTKGADQGKPSEHQDGEQTGGAGGDTQSKGSAPVSQQAAPGDQAQGGKASPSPATAAVANGNGNGAKEEEAAA